MFCLYGYNILKPFVYLQHETADYNIWQIFWRIYGGAVKGKVDFPQIGLEKGTTERGIPKVSKSY